MEWPFLNGIYIVNDTDIRLARKTLAIIVMILIIVI